MPNDHANGTSLPYARGLDYGDLLIKLIISSRRADSREPIRIYIFFCERPRENRQVRRVLAHVQESAIDREGGCQFLRVRVFLISYGAN